MQTSLPDLPFRDYADAALDESGIYSTAQCGRRRHPRTDLKALTPWTSFPNDIHNAILAIPHARTPFHIDGPTSDAFVDSELTIHHHALDTLLRPAANVLMRLGVNGRFAQPGGGNSAIVGDPDFSWITSSASQPHPKLTVEYKPWWAVDLLNLVTAFDKKLDDALSKQSLHALHQTYGYMTFNNNRFGILTNWRHALFLRRAETQKGKTLQYYLVELDRAGQPISMLKALVGMVLLAEDDWFCSPPTLASDPPGQTFGKSGTAWNDRKVGAKKYHMQPVNGAYQCFAIDFRLCHFDISSARHSGENGCVVTAQLLPPSVGQHVLHAVCKVVDAFHNPDAATSLYDEAGAYAALQDLQGKVIPRLYGFYEVWGILQFLALEPVGNAISENEQINPTLGTNMKAALKCIHDAGYIHGDIARRNFCITGNGKVFLVDLETCRPFGNPSEPDDEMDEVDRL
ncbi:uncharacterized protein LACBIDRAFT_297282 [Laccaria bicolor S238N-H82]|uniref:Predicted protein n=1 Tax=Laccaria bicolor (strain S238N-H82 / ATCC MYA-4686) TaxID=486041 RepID=B0DAF5_LACBS|nr:uncharacterized protein LACBIDRAFT_297282 [Laccaria bicolor S238N-H82]EDR08523.1 predicted protein [Laccaria bicolor S238N-H82]|eukprot:XP_001880748.1 predicted protein [Laccaria bicolor S238N-H82]